jgi:hypothetical protein
VSGGFAGVTTVDGEFETFVPVDAPGRPHLVGFGGNLRRGVERWGQMEVYPYCIKTEELK